MTTRIIAVANQKGGVGKTTTTVNLGAYLADHGKRVLLIDMDPQANATSSLGYDKRALSASVYDLLVGDKSLPETIIVTRRLGLDLVPAGLALAGAEVELVGAAEREYRLARRLAPGATPAALTGNDYDVVLIDCPPSLGLLTVNALTATHGVIIPIQCEYLAMEGMTQLLGTIKRIRERLNPSLKIAGVLMTMYDSRTSLSPQVVNEVRAHFPHEIFQTIVPRSIRLAEAPSYGQSIAEYDPLSRGAQAYAALADELASRL